MIDGRGGNDTLVGSRVLGGDGNDQIIGLDDYVSVLYGEAGNDTIKAGSQDGNHIEGDAGNDTLDGNSGVDYLYGGSGNDSLRGFKGDDQLFGGSGDDRLAGGGGDDLFHGGTGDDRIFGGAGESSNDLYVYRAGDGHDTYNMGPVGSVDGNDTLLIMGPAPSEVMDALSRDGDDLVITLDGDNSLTITDAFAGGGMVDQILLTNASEDDPNNPGPMDPPFSDQVITGQEIFEYFGEQALADALPEQAYDYEDPDSGQYWNFQYSVLRDMNQMEATGATEIF